jgi:hypothetical protein
MQDERLAQYYENRFRVMRRLDHRFRVILVIGVISALLPVIFWAVGLTEYTESLRAPPPDRSPFERIATASACMTAAAWFVALAGAMWKRATDQLYLDSKEGHSIWAGSLWARSFAVIGWGAVLFTGYRFFSGPYSAEPIRFSLSLVAFIVGWVFVLWTYLFG